MLPPDPIVPDFRTRNWSMSLEGFDFVVTDEDDIAQAIIVICSTPKRSLPLNPDFGFDPLPYIDKPIHKVANSIIRDVAVAIATWEPRAQVLSITPSLDDDGAGIRLVIAWTPIFNPTAAPVVTTFAV